MWKAEEREHSRALARFLDAYAHATGVEIPPRQPTPVPKVSWYEAALAHVGGPFGTVVAAAHMTWGAANELLTMNGYRLLAEQCDHPILAELLRRIAAQEARHYSFYVLQAEWRLTASRLARVAIPRLMAGSWTPVGVGDGYKTAGEFGRVVDVLVRCPDSQRIIDRMDRRFSALPGLEHLRIYRHTAAAA